MGYRPFNPNPFGRNVEDCSVRALAAATGKSWEAIHAALDVYSFSAGTMPHSDDVWGAYLREHGFVKRSLPDSCVDRYTVNDFAADHPQGTYVLKLSGHVVCVRDGDVWDTWNSGNEIVIYYFEKG